MLMEFPRIDGDVNMGISITATNSSYDFDMGYGGFFNLRKT